MTETQKIAQNKLKKIHAVLHVAAPKSIGKYKILNNILNNKQIQEAKKLKRIAKHEYQEKIKTKNENLIQAALTQYVENQENLRTIINNYITRATEKKLQSIYTNGYISKSYRNIIRQLRQNNLEDLYALKMMTYPDYSVKVKSKIIHVSTASLSYSKHSLPRYEKHWSSYTGNKTHIYQENRLHENDEYNQPIQLNEVKRALRLLRNSKSEDPHAIKTDFLKYGGEAIAILLKGYFKQILLSEDTPTQWNSSILINIDKGRQDKEKLDNKRGISLTSNIAKLLEKIIISRLNNNLQFREAQAGVQPGNNTLTNY